MPMCAISIVQLHENMYGKYHPTLYEVDIQVSECSLKAGGNATHCSWSKGEVIEV